MRFWGGRTIDKNKVLRKTICSVRETYQGLEEERGRGDRKPGKGEEAEGIRKHGFKKKKKLERKIWKPPKLGRQSQGRDTQPGNSETPSSPSLMNTTSTATPNMTVYTTSKTNYVTYIKLCQY